MTIEPVSFQRTDFTSTEFLAQDFIASRRHLPIDQLKFDLLSLLKTLKNELVELINHDYAQFISLSSNLVGVDSMLTDLRIPLSQIEAHAMV